MDAPSEPSEWGTAASEGLSARDVLELVPDGIVVVGGDRCTTLVNPRAARLLGRDADELTGLRAEEALPLLDDAGRSWWEVADPWDGLRTRRGHRERMLLLPGRGHVLVTMSYVRRVRGGPVVRVIVALRDTEARRRAEAGAAELLSTVAHELRSPLSSVAGFSRTLLRRWDRFEDAQRREMVETIQADAARLSRLLAELLDVSRLDTGRLRLRPEAVDLGEHIEAHLVRCVAAGHDPARFDWSSPGRPVRVLADPDRIDQVLANLLDNALRHGAGTVRITVETFRRPDGTSCVTIGVADEGEGIAPEHRPLVFTKFWHGQQRQGSTGLGLYLARGIAQAHGGVLAVDAAPGGGALFRLTIPVGTDAPVG